MPVDPQPLNKLSLTVADVPHAPLVYFEEAPNFGNCNGVIHITLATYRHIPDGKGGITTDLVVEASLRSNVPAMLTLRKAIDDALLLAAPPGDGGKKN